MELNSSSLYLVVALTGLVPGLAAAVIWFLYRALRMSLGTIEKLQGELLGGLVSTKSADPSTIHHFLSRYGGQRLNLPKPPKPDRNKEDEKEPTQSGMSITHGA